MAFDYTNFLEVDATVESDFSFTNRAGTTNSLLAVRNTAGEWCLETTGATASTGTGPTANPSGRSAYIYMESSTPAISTVWAMKRKTSFNASTQNVFLDLIYNLNCITGGQFYVEYATVASPNETTDWTIHSTINYNLTDAWVSNTFDFSAQTSTTLWIRIRATTPTTDFTYDLAFSTWREYGTDKTTPGVGFTLNSSRKAQTTAGIETPSNLVFNKTIEWATITLALRKSVSAGAIEFIPSTQFNELKTTGSIINTDNTNIDGWIITGNLVLQSVKNLLNNTITGSITFTTAGTYTLTNCTVNEVINTSGGAVIINLTNGTVTTNTGPSITINNSVPVKVTVRSASDNSVIEGSRVFIKTTTGGPEAVDVVIVNGVSDSNGVVENLGYNFLGNQPVVGVVRRGSTSPLYKTSQISGTILNSGIDISIFLVKDE